MAPSAKIDPLKGAGNWNIWRIRLKALLAKDDIGYTIKPKKEFSKGTPKDDIEEYTKKRKSDSEKASAIIRLNISDSPLIQTANIDETDAEALYSRLEALYAPKGFSTEFIIAKELFETNLSRCGNSIEAYLAKIRYYTDELAIRNKPIPKAIIAAFALNNLSNEYSPIIAAITTKYRDNEDDNDIDLDDLFNAIIDESRRLKTLEPQEMAMNTQARPNKASTGNSKPKCAYCKKLGHKVEKCWKKHPELKPKKAIDEESTLLITEDEITL